MAEDMGALKSWMLSKISWDLSLAKDWERLMDEFLAEYAARQIRAYMDIMQTAAVDDIMQTAAVGALPKFTTANY